MRICVSRIVVLLVFAMSVLAGASPAIAQSAAPQAQTRPKIGLALGGGSARASPTSACSSGSKNITFDRHVVGTSMGGLVAGAVRA